MNNIGVIGISGKPVHQGHWALIERAANENDCVMLYVSMTDRKRKNEFLIRGCDMFNIWKQFLEPLLPRNVKIEYSRNPITKIWKYLGKVDLSNEYKKISLYGDDVDIARCFGDDVLAKYVPRLFETNQIQKVEITRKQEINISGTKMRKFISNNDFKNFKSFLPPVSSDEATKIWRMLRMQTTE